ncbi:MAG: GAF domain-containing protein, partial [Anaerolineae bacterium]|nr:GAF domain-containing protein [Anaerolineae bacterium]
VHAVYTYLVLLFGIALLVQAFVRSPRLYRVQAGVLLIGALVPLVGDVLSTYDLITFPLDLTPFTFAIAGLAVAWGIFRFRLFDIVPVARSAVVDSMGGGVLVLDMHNRIVDINRAAQNIIDYPASEVVGQPIAQILVDRPDLIERYRDVTEAHSELTLGEGEAQRSYDLQISPVHDRRGRLIGRVIVLHDSTEQKRAEASLVAQKQLFENLVAVARATAKHPSLEATLRSAVNMAAALTEAEHGGMFLLDGDGVVTHSVRARSEVTPAEQEAAGTDLMGRRLTDWVFRHRQPALIYEMSRDDRWQDLPDAPHRAHSALAIPIVSGSAVLGVLTLTHSKPNHFTAEHSYLIQAAADQMTLALRNSQMYDEQRRLADRQTKLYEALRAVGEHLDPETIAHAAVRSVARLTGWPAVGILLPDEAGTHLVFRSVAGALPPAEGWRLRVDRGVIGRTFQTAQRQYVPDVKLDPDYVSGHPAIRSELAVPLRRGERVLGVLDAASDQLAGFTADDILLAESLAEAIALALDNARLYAEIRRYAADLGALYTFSRAISRSLVLDDVLAETLQTALTSLDFDAGLISLADPNDGHLYLAAERGLSAATVDRIRQEGLAGTSCAYVHERGEAVSVSDIEQETSTALDLELEKEAPLTFSEMRGLGMVAYSGIPLLYQERSLGTLSLFATQPRVLSAEDRGLQIAIGRQIATAVTNAQLYQAVADERGRLQSLIESSRDGIMLIGMDQCVLVVNAPALDFLRLAGQPEDWVNRPVQDALTALERHAPGFVPVILAEIDRVRMGDDMPGEGESDAPPRAIHWQSLPVMTDTTLVGRLLVLRDVTEERSLERMRDDLVHAMVHDLRNPLTSISGALSFLDDSITDTLSSGEQQLWEIAQKSTESMLGLVRAILEISQLESGQVPLDHALIPLDDLIAGVLDSQVPLAVEKGVRLEGDVPPDLPPAWADSTMIERVLQNLLGNAIKFTPAGGAVQVSAWVDPSEPSTLLVSVSDTGSGIPPEIQGRLFQRFVTGQQEGRGSGLGLAFCKMVMEAHGERIWVESTSESGTTFAFTLPLPPALES